MRCTCFGTQAPAKVGVHHKKMMRFGTTSSGSMPDNTSFIQPRGKAPALLAVPLHGDTSSSPPGQLPRPEKPVRNPIAAWRDGENDSGRKGMFNGKISESENGIRVERAVILLSVIYTPGRERQGAPECLSPPGESVRAPGNNCCRHSRGPRGRVGAFPAGTGRPRGSAEGCPAGSRPAGAP